MSQEGKIAVVTGGGRGIGAAISHALAADGYSVIVNYASNGTSAERVVKGIQQAGGRALAMQADVSKEEEVLRMFGAIDKLFGAPAVLVNNGGITGGFSRVEAVAAQTLQEVFAVNVLGAFLCSREAVKRPDCVDARIVVQPLRYRLTERVLHEAPQVGIGQGGIVSVVC